MTRLRYLIPAMVGILAVAEYRYYTGLPETSEQAVSCMKDSTFGEYSRCTARLTHVEQRVAFNMVRNTK